MSSKNYLFTSESVSEGHPDKVADQISDAVLDACLTEDPSSRVACETLITTGIAVIAGEITTKAQLDVEGLVRSTVNEIGYNNPECGFDGNTCSVDVRLDTQSPDIAMGVDTGGAGDQGMMFGYACNETEELMPMPIITAHKLLRELAAQRRTGKMQYLRPDSKSQVSTRYIDDKPVGIETIVISTQHSPDVSQEQIKADTIEYVIKPTIGDLWNDSIIIHVNPTGRFVVGGPHGDCGLTGRKIIVDTYGGMGRHGGGAFSGKDPSKVDRSAAYACRYVAKNVVAAGLADRCELQVAYAIGVADPVSVYIDTFGTGKVDHAKIEQAVKDNVDLTPKGIMEKLDLRRPIYKASAAYGHFGRSEFPWERTDIANSLKKACGL